MGVCLVKKDKNNVIGIKNQYIFELVFIAKININNEIIDIIDA